MFTLCLHIFTHVYSMFTHCLQCFYGMLMVTDVNECKLGTADCPEGARCKNTRGSYRCICPRGTDPVMKDGKLKCESKCGGEG